MFPISVSRETNSADLHRKNQIFVQLTTNSIISIDLAKGRTQKKNVIFSDIVTIAFDPHPP